MIAVTNIFKKNKFFDNMKIDRVLVEGQYPVLFTLKSDEKEYLAICPVMNSEEIIWLLSETTVGIIINMLEDSVTIRDAFMDGSSLKWIIRYDGNEVTIEEKLKDEISNILLPDKGEFMDADEGEFDEELAYYKQLVTYRKIELTPLKWILWPVKIKKFSAPRNQHIFNVCQYKYQLS